MPTIEKQYILGADGKPIAVVLDIDAFREIEEMLEYIENLKIVDAGICEPNLDWDEVKSSLE